MRDPRTIAQEIDVARQDLQARLGELRELVVDKLDVKKHARQAVEHGKQQMIDLVHRGKQRMIALAQRGKQELRGVIQRIRIGERAHPMLALVATTGFLVLAMWFMRRRMHRESAWRRSVAPGRHTY